MICFAISLLGPGADQICTENIARAADPADTTRRHADHQSMIGNIFCNDGTCTDGAIASECISADDRGVGADRGATSHQGRSILIFALDFGAGRQDIGEDAGRATEHALLERHALVNADIVLDFTVVANFNVRPHHDILPQGAVAADPGARKDVAEVPNSRAFADFAALINIGALMNLHLILPARLS